MSGGILRLLALLLRLAELCQGLQLLYVSGHSVFLGIWRCQNSLGGVQKAECRHKRLAVVSYQSVQLLKALQRARLTFAQQ